MPKSKTSSKPKRPPPGVIRTLVDTGLGAVLMDAWERTKEVIEATAEDGTMADLACADSIPILLTFLHEHEDLARTLFQSGFMAALQLVAAIRAPEGSAAADGPLRGAGHHRTVGRA
jgi:hypothetical protein